MNQEKETMQKQLRELEATIETEYSNMMGLMVLKHGEPCYERYFHGGTATSKLHVYSITKSIVSLLLGIAIEQGKIESIKQPILDFFPDYPRKKNNPIQAHITLEDMLTMKAPYRYKDSPLTYMRYFISKDYLKFSLNQLGGKDVIGRFRYTPIIGPDILSGILSTCCGTSTLDFAKEYLFEPLGIEVASSIFLHSAKEQTRFNSSTDQSGWVQDAQGLHTGGWGLTLTLEDMAKLGQTCLDHGIWKGKQVLPAAWLHTCMSEHSRWIEEDLAYGYLWWVDPENGFMAMGDGGNVIYVNTKEQLVIVMNGLFCKKDKDRIPLIKEHIEPIFR